MIKKKVLCELCISDTVAVENRTSTLILVVLALLICAGMTAAFWPGVGTWEVLQFAQQRKLPVMNDWKSPLVVHIYWLSHDFFKSTGPILLIQQALFWSGLALLAWSTFKGAISRVLFFMVVAILPPIWITEILLWKEAWTLSFLSLSIGAMFAYMKNRRLLYGVVAILSAILLTATRQNAVLLTFPAFYVVARMAAVQTRKVKTKQSRAIFTSTFAILLIVALGVNWVINIRGKQRCHIWHHGLLWDLAAISISEERMLIPDEFRKCGEAGSLARIRLYFTCYHSDPLFFLQGSPLKLYGTPWSGCYERPPLGMLLERWLDTILTYPGAYLRHRLIYLKHLLNIPDVSNDWLGMTYYRIDSEFTPKANRSSLFDLIRTSQIYEAVVLGIPFRGWIYPVVFLLSGIGLARKASIEDTYLWMLWLAGIAYFASFMVIGSGAVMRYLSVYAVLGPAILAGRWRDSQLKRGDR